MPVPDPLLLAYVSLTFALVITPGATTAVVVRNTLDGGIRKGLWSAVGAAAGNSTHAVATGLGLAALLARSPHLLQVVQVAGGCYLAWLGLQSARRAHRHEAVPAARRILAEPDPAPPHHAWREGLLVNLLNPAIATFYLVVVPSFVPAAAARTLYIWLAATHVVMAFLVHCLWALALHRLRAVLSRPSTRRGLELAAAAALLLLAARVVATALATAA